MKKSAFFLAFSLLSLFSVLLPTAPAEAVLFEMMLLDELFGSDDDDSPPPKKEKPSRLEPKENAIVRISIGNHPENQYIGTGFFVRNENSVVTSFLGAASLLLVSGPLRIHDRSGAEIPFVRIKQLSAIADVAILETEGRRGQVLKIDGDNTDDEEKVFISGFFPSTRPFRFMSKPDIHYRRGVTYFSLPPSADLRGGLGGTPVFDERKKKVIGMVEGRIGRFLMATHAETWESLLEKPPLPAEKTAEELIHEEINHLKATAEKSKGNTRAMYKLAMMYKEGIGINQNKKEAMGWFRKAEKGGNIQAKYEPALMLLQRNEIAGNEREIYNLLHFAAKQGHAKAGVLLNSLEGEKPPSGIRQFCRSLFFG